ncbi:MAG: YdbL family protein [Gammaproteobacteria bacterium]|nr:YdbL family protein [Gammaproteobacteria bacterium]
MQRTIKVLLLSVGLLFASTFVSAADINSAKSQGFIGERADGYLGVVDQTAAGDVKALVRDINARRRAEYERIAKNNGLSRQEIESLGGKKAIAKTAVGGWIYRTRWEKK